VSKEFPIEMKTRDKLRGAAFHEAGHVIVAREFGLPVGEIAIGIDVTMQKVARISARPITCRSSIRSRFALPGSLHSRCLISRRTTLLARAITHGLSSLCKG
jgi:hypothetical protein